MEKQGKGNEADEQQLRVKMSKVLQEVEAAQAREVRPEEILKRISSYFAAEPALAIPLIDALAGVPTPQTAFLLEEMMTILHDKGSIKAIKRSLYRLRQKGVQWEQQSSHEKPILRPLQTEAPQGYVGAMDSTGSRVIIIARPRPQGRMRVYFSIVNDQEGIQRLEVTDLTKKGIKEFIGASLSSEEFPVVEVPGGYNVHLLHEAAELSQKLDKAIPLGYEEIKQELRDITWDASLPLIYQHVPEDSVKDNAQLLKESGELHKIPPFSSWFLHPDEVRPYAEAIKEAEKSHLVLTPQQKDARLSSLYQEALEGLIPAKKRLLWKRRLEEAAYILWKRGREEEASMAMSAAVDLKTSFSSLDPNPFCWNLILKSLYGLLETERGEQEQKQKSSLIVSP
ncbi:MAG: hypothetical protein JXA50_06840 [Deltaproteobacteria bacterium]|nr:hypothetical protein [Deltaproteobacteria bacterium]